MPRRSVAALALAAAVAVLSSCAVNEPSGGGPSSYDAPPAMSAARMGLPPLYRGFYDALEGEGDWVLIEPYGWVFRPRVNFDAWRPYQEGWWEPSDTWGWVWNSTDPFGWVTDHYGSWFYDDYQGWVWTPGPVWGPAWVAWVEVGDYVGWAPLGPADYDGYSNVPGGLFTFAAAQQFGGMQAGAQASFLRRPPASDATVHEITNFASREGVSYNRGPDFTEMRRLGSPIPVEVPKQRFREIELPGAEPPGEAQLLQRTKRALAVGVMRLQREGAGAAPTPGTEVSKPAPEPLPKPRIKEAPPDSTVRRPGPQGKPPRPEEKTRRPGRGAEHRGAERDTTKG